VRWLVLQVLEPQVLERLAQSAPPVARLVLAQPEPLLVWLPQARWALAQPAPLGALRVPLDAQRVLGPERVQLDVPALARRDAARPAQRPAGSRALQVQQVQRARPAGYGRLWRRLPWLLSLFVRRLPRRLPLRPGP